jgi:hypothetical protein
MLRVSCRATIGGIVSRANGLCRTTIGGIVSRANGLCRTTIGGMVPLPSVFSNKRSVNRCSIFLGALGGMGASRDSLPTQILRVTFVSNDRSKNTVMVGLCVGRHQAAE